MKKTFGCCSQNSYLTTLQSTVSILLILIWYPSRDCMWLGASKAHTSLVPRSFHNTCAGIRTIEETSPESGEYYRTWTLSNCEPHSMIKTTVLNLVSRRSLGIICFRGNVGRVFGVVWSENHWRISRIGWIKVSHLPGFKFIYFIFRLLSTRATLVDLRLFNASCLVNWNSTEL